MPTSIPEICKTFGANNLPSSAYKNGNMWGLFKLARRVEQGTKWHPANDDLRGTDKYGNPPTNPRTGPTGTMQWKYNQVQYFMFSTGDFSEWYVNAFRFLFDVYWSVVRLNQPIYCGPG